MYLETRIELSKYCPYCETIFVKILYLYPEMVLESKNFEQNVGYLIAKEEEELSNKVNEHKCDKINCDHSKLSNRKKSEIDEIKELFNIE